MLLPRTIPAGMARYSVERPHVDFSSEDVERIPEDLSSEEREVREAGAVLMLAGVMLIVLGVLMGGPFA